MNQGFFGALEQYWTVEPKARLHRRNTYFNDAQVSNATALRVGIVSSAVILLLAFVLGIMGACFV